MIEVKKKVYVSYTFTAIELSQPEFNHAMIEVDLNDLPTRIDLQNMMAKREREKRGEMPGFHITILDARILSEPEIKILN